MSDLRNRKNRIVEKLKTTKEALFRKRQKNQMQVVPVSDFQSGRYSEQDYVDGLQTNQTVYPDLSIPGSPQPGNSVCTVLTKQQERFIWCNFLKIIFGCRDQHYSTSDYDIYVHYKIKQFLQKKQFNILIQNKENKEYNQWEISYDICKGKWLMNKINNEAEIVYLHPYFIFQDPNTQKIYKYKLKLPSWYFCEIGGLKDGERTIVQFKLKDKQINISSDENNLQFLIIIALFIDQQNLHILG